jgi:hypothetical protein
MGYTLVIDNIADYSEILILGLSKKDRAYTSAIWHTFK